MHILQNLVYKMIQNQKIEENTFITMITIEHFDKEILINTIPKLEHAKQMILEVYHYSKQKQYMSLNLISIYRPNCS